MLGELNQYMAIIGFSTFDGKKSLASTFLSPVLFYITACILEDYFKERCAKLEQEKEEQIMAELRQS